MQLDPSAFVADPELLPALEQRSVPIACEEDHVLFRQGDAPVGLYVLLHGAATLVLESTAGNALFTARAKPGSLLGLPGLIANEPFTLTATAHAGAQVGYIPRDDFMALMRSDPAFSLGILKVLAAEVRSTRRIIL